MASFTGPTSDMDCGVSVREGTKAWYAYYENPQTGASLRGSCTVTFTRLTGYIAGGGATTYRFQGRLEARLVALESSGATGTVDVVSNFTL